MALIPEDGTGKPDANSFVSLAFANDYFTQRPNEAWEAADTTNREAALLYATRWLDRRYQWRGSIKVYGPPPQALSFPRVGIVDDEGRSYPDDDVPILIREATCELSANQAGEGILNRLDDLGGALSQITVDVITLKFRDWSPGGWTIGLVDRLVSPLTRAGTISTGSFSVNRMARA